MRQNNRKLYGLAQGAMIAAIYVALTMVFAPISFGPVQFRIAEALCILPFFTPAAVPGLFAGCLLSNLLCGAMPLDVVFGSLVTSRNMIPGSGKSGMLLTYSSNFFMMVSSLPHSDS